METFAEKLLSFILGGGPNAIICILIAIVAALGYWVHRLEKQLSTKDDRLDDVVDKTFAANYALAASLDSLRTMIFELVKSK